MAKHKTGKLPRKIGGVKVPKKLRKGGGSLLALVNQPVAREIALAALLAALSARKEVRKGARALGSEAAQAGEQAGAKVDWVGPALAAAATEVGRRLLGAYHDGNGAGAFAQLGKTAQVIRIVERLAAAKR
jgi:hypothetical protein